jgi:O-antigen ligase
MFFAGSRFPSLWLNLNAPFSSTVDYLEGSPLDRAIFLLLITAGLAVLAGRRVEWKFLFRENRWIWIYFAWGAASLLWSDYPFVSFKRLIKAIGNLIMATVILTEKNPYDAAGTVLRRVGIVLVPLSFLFIKYYPDLGRTYHPWTDEPMYTGVALQKNSLGQICLLSGIYFCWALFRGRQAVYRPLLPVTVVFLCMIGWLLKTADSATSTMCLILVVAMFLGSRVPFFRRQPQRLLKLVVAVACLYGLLEATVGVSTTIVEMLGRDMTLTTRVPIWQDLLQLTSNPLIGAGYESFWLDPRLQGFWEEHGGIRQAHNGYLETYLNLGVVGLTLLLGSILAGFSKVYQSLKSRQHGSGIFRLCLITPVIVYNWTEATFVGVSNMWLLLLLGSLDLSALSVLAATRHQERNRCGMDRPTSDGSVGRSVKWSENRVGI